MRKMRRVLAFALAVMMFMSNTVMASATSTSSVPEGTIVEQNTDEVNPVEITTSSSGEEESTPAEVVEESSAEPSGEGSDITPSEPSGEGDDVTDPSDESGSDEVASSETTTETTTETVTETVTEETTVEETTEEETTEEETTEELPEAPLLKSEGDTQKDDGEVVNAYINNTGYYFKTISDAIYYIDNNVQPGTYCYINLDPLDEGKSYSVSGNDLVSTSGADITLRLSQDISVTADNGTTVQVNISIQGSEDEQYSMNLADGVSLQLIEGSSKERYYFRNFDINFSANDTGDFIVGEENAGVAENDSDATVAYFTGVNMNNVEDAYFYAGFQNEYIYENGGLCTGNGVDFTNVVIDLPANNNSTHYYPLVDFAVPFTATTLDLNGSMKVKDLTVDGTMSATGAGSLTAFGEVQIANLTTTTTTVTTPEGETYYYRFGICLNESYKNAYSNDNFIQNATLNLSGELNVDGRLSVNKAYAVLSDNGWYQEPLDYQIGDTYATVTLGQGEDVTSSSLTDSNNYSFWVPNVMNCYLKPVENGVENTYNLIIEEAPDEIAVWVDPDGDDRDNMGYYFANFQDVKDFIFEDESAAGYVISVNESDLEVSGDVLDYSSFIGTFQNEEGQVVGAEVCLMLNGNTLKVTDDATIAVDSIDGGCYNEYGEIAGSFSDISLAEKEGITLTLAPRALNDWENYSIGSYAIRILSNASNIKIGRESDWATSEAHMGITFVNEVMRMDLYGRVNIESTSQANVINNLYVHNVSENNNGQEAYITNMTVNHLYATEGNVGFDKVNVTNTLYLKAGQNFGVKAGGSAEIKNVEVWENENDPYACASFELERTMKLAAEDDVENPTFTGATEKVKTSTIKITGTVDRQGNAQPIMVRKLKGWEYSADDYRSVTEEFVNGETVITSTNTTVSPDSFWIEGSYRFLQRSSTALKAAGAVLRVIYEGENRNEKQYTSLEEAVKNMPADFNSESGSYVFQILNDTKLTADVTVPDFVEELIFETESYGYHDEGLDDWVSLDNTRYQKFLDLNGKKISTSAGIRMFGGVRIYSSIATAGKLVSTNGECALEIREQYTFVDAQGNEVDRAPVLDNVLVTTKEGGVNIWCMDEYGNDDDNRDNIMRASFETRGFFLDGGRWIIEDNAKTKNYIKAADLRVNGCNIEDENAESYVEESYLAVSQLTLTNGYGEIYGGLDAGTATLSGAGLDIYGWSNIPTLSATNSDVWVNGSLCSENISLNNSNLCEFEHVEVATKLTMSNGAQVEVWNDFHVKEITAAASKILVAPEGGGSLHADKISVTTAFAGDAVGDYTLQNNGQLLVREKLSMTAGTLENGGLIEAGEVAVKDLNNSQYNECRGQILCNKFTNTGNMYLSEDSHILINESGTLNNVNVGDRYGNYGYALIGRSENATVTFKGTFTRNDEDQQLLGFVTNEYVDKIGDNSLAEDENGNEYTEYHWDWINLSNDNGTPDYWDDDYDADYVIALESDEVLFNTEIAKFPVEAVRVLPWTVAGDIERVDNSNNSVYQSGKELKIIGEYIHVSSINADGNSGTWLKSFTNWKDAVAYINTLNNASVKYVIDITADIDINGKLELPTKAAEIVIRSDNEIVLSYQGDIALNSNTAFENIMLEPYSVSNGKIVPYQSSIDTKGKLLDLINVEVVAREYGEDGISVDYVPLYLNAIKGTASTQLNLQNGTLIMVKTKISGLNEIYIANGSAMTADGGISVNNLVFVNWPEWIESNQGRDGYLGVVVNGSSNVLEVKNRLNMFSPTEIYCGGSIKINNIYSNCSGNILSTEKENQITISGRVLSDDMPAAWNKVPVVAERDDANNIVGYRYPTEEELNNWETSVAEENKAEVMPFAVQIEALDGGTKLASAPLVSPIWFVTNSDDADCDFDFTHKEDKLIVSGTNENDAVVLSVLMGVEEDNLITQEMNRFATLQDAFNEIDKIASPIMSYVITLNSNDEAKNVKTGAAMDYTFPKQAEDIFIVGSGDTKTISYKKDLKLQSNVTFMNVTVKASTSGTVSIGDFGFCLQEGSTFDTSDNTVTYTVSGSGVTKGSAMAIWDETVRFAKVTGVNYVTLVGSSAGLLVDGEMSIGDLFTTAGGSVTVLGKFSVNNIEAKNMPATIVTAPKLTRDSKTKAVTKTEATMTVSGEIQGDVNFELSDGTVEGRLSVVNTDGLTSLAAGNGIPFVKAAKANTETVSIADWTGYIYKKSGIFVYKNLAPQVELNYAGADGNVLVKFETFADAVTEINNLKTKRDYIIRFLFQVDEEGTPAAITTVDTPVTLTMPNANCANTLILTADTGADVYYMKDITFNSNVILDNINFVQVVTEKGINYTLDEAQSVFEKFYDPVKVTVKGAYTLEVNGDVTFNNAMILDGSSKAVLLVDEEGTLYAAQPTTYVEDRPNAFVEGIVKNFATVQVDGGSLWVNEYTSGTFEKISYKATELNVTTLDITNDGRAAVGNGGYITASATVKNLNMTGGELDVYGKAAFTNVTLSGYLPENESEADIPDIAVYGQTFNITGTLTTTSGAYLQTELDAKKLTSVLNISGNVVLEDPDDKIIVNVEGPEGFYLGGAYTYTDKKGNEVEAVYSNKLLTASKADISAFKADPECLKDNAQEYQIEQDTEGYILQKSGNDILVRYSDEVEVALSTVIYGENGEFIDTSLYNYYTSFNEAVAVIESLKDTSASYEIELLNDVGGDIVKDVVTYEKVNLPSKAANLSIFTANGSAIYYNNDLSLGCDTHFSGVDLKPQGANGKEKGISVNGYTLSLDHIASTQIGKITGKNKADTVWLYLPQNLTISGDITNVMELVLVSTNENSNDVAKLSVTGKTTVTNLVYASASSLTVGKGSTIKNIISPLPEAMVNELYYSDLSITGDITVSHPDSRFNFYHVIERTPAQYDAKGVKLDLVANSKLVSVKQAALTNVVFYNTDYAPIANAQWSGGAVYAVEDSRNAVTVYKADGTTKLADCVDLAQASAYITAVADKDADYVIGISNDIADTAVTDTTAVSKITMPAKDKMASVVVDGNESVDPVITFTGDIATNGVVTLQDIQLKNSADFSIAHKKNSDVKKDGISGRGELTLNNVTVVTTETLSNGKSVVKGYLKNITGEKNVTKLAVNNMSEVMVDVNDIPNAKEKVNLSGGITNIVEMTLCDTALVTNAKSEVNELKLASGGSWVGMNATIFGSVDNSAQDSNSYLGTYLSNNVPQMTINGTVMKPVMMKLYDFATKKEIYEGRSAEDTNKSRAELYENKALILAKTEASEKFIAEPFVEGMDGNWTFAAGVQARKDVKNYVYNGDISKMEVLLQASVNGGEASETYVATYAEAINIINNIGDKNADYTVILRATGANTNNEEVSVIKTAVSNGVAAYGSLALPAANKAKSLTITSTNASANPFVIKYTGTMAPKCDLYFENVILTEGTVDAKEADGFKESNFVTPVLGTVKVTFGAGTSTLNAHATAMANIADDVEMYGLAEDATYALVFSKVTSSKGSVLDVCGNAAYVIGDASLATLQANESGVLSVNGKATIADVVMENDSTMLLTSKNIIKITNIAGNGELAINTTYTNKDWLKATPQLTIDGILENGTGLTVYQYMYDTDMEAYRLLNDDEVMAVTIEPEDKPAAYQKVIAAPKLQVSEDVRIVTDAESFNYYSLFKMDGVVYLSLYPACIDVVGYMMVGEGEEAVRHETYKGSFFTWEQAVKEIDKLNFAPSKTSAGWNYDIILREDIGAYGEPIKNLTLPTKAAKVTIVGKDDCYTNDQGDPILDEEGNPIADIEGIMMTGTTVTLKTDLEIRVPIVAMKKTGNNYYDTVYTLNTGNYDLLMNEVPRGADYDNMGWHEPMMKLSGSAKGTATIIPEFNPEGDGTTYVGMFTQISNVGIVTLGNTRFYDEGQGTDGNGYSCFAVSDGITGVGELILEPGAIAVCDKKDINVKNLTMGDSVEPVLRTDEYGAPEVDEWGNEILDYYPNELQSGISAMNITVSDTLSMASSYMKAGLTTGNDGKVTLNNVILRDNHNTIEGKQDKNGKSQINIKGTVNAVGDHIDRYGAAITIGLYYNNSAWKYVSLSDDLILLTAPKAAASWFNPCYGGTDDQGEYYRNMGDYMDGYDVYKSGNNIQYGRVDNMEVRLIVEDGTSMLFETFEEAVKAIDSMGLQKEVEDVNGKVTKVYQNYTIELLNDVEIGNEKLNGQFKTLSLPSKAGEVVLWGNGHVMKFSGNVTLKCNTVFEGIKLLPMKTVKGEAVPTTANFAVGNFRMVWANSACDEDFGEFGDLKDCVTCIGNITGGAKGELFIIGNSRLKAKDITGLNAIRFVSVSDEVPVADEDCGQILTDGNVTIKELYYMPMSGGILRVRGNLTLNAAYVYGECSAQIWRFDDKAMKVNGVTLTEKDENGKTIKINESVIYISEGNSRNIQVKTVATKASTVAPGTKIITGKYLDANDWDLYSFDTSNGTNYERNSYMSGNDIYMGAEFVGD